MVLLDEISGGCPAPAALLAHHQQCQGRREEARRPGSLLPNAKGSPTPHPGLPNP